MANLSEKAIKASFMKLLDQRPYHDITVRDIVEDCGLSRNSFYYHFQDIPSLMEEIIREETERIIAEYPSINSIEECVDVIISFALQNRRAVFHFYNSINRDIYERYMWENCDYTVRTYWATVFPNVQIQDSDRETIIWYAKSICFGVVSNWLENGMRQDLRAAFHRLFELKRGSIEEMVSRCETISDESDVRNNSHRAAS